MGCAKVARINMGNVYSTMRLYDMTEKAEVK